MAMYEKLVDSVGDIAGVVGFEVSSEPKTS